VKTRALQTRLPVELYAKLEQLAAADSRSTSQLARLIIERALRSENPLAPPAPCPCDPKGTK
jgi:predicted DNA-binding protein